MTKTMAQRAILSLRASVGESADQDAQSVDYRPGFRSLLRAQPGFTVSHTSIYWFEDGSHVYYSRTYDKFTAGVSEEAKP